MPLWLGDTTRTSLRLVVVRDKLCIIPCLSKVCLPTARSRGSIRTSIEIQPSLSSLSCLHPIKACSSTWILQMWSPTPMTRSERFRLFTTRSVWSLPSSIPWLMIPRSLYLPRHRVIGLSGSSYPPHHRFHQCQSYSRNPWIDRANGHSTCILLWIERG